MIKRAFKLTITKAKVAARRYYRAGLLSAQHPKPDSRICRYVVDEKYRCAIGAALPKSVLERDPSGLIRGLNHYGVVVAHPAQLSILQSAHDAWCNTSRQLGADHAETIQCRDSFLDIIGIKRAA